MRPLTEPETKVLFTKLANYTGNSLKNLIAPLDDGDRFCFRLNKDRVYYVRLSIANFATSIAREKLLSLGTCIGMSIVGTFVEVLLISPFCAVSSFLCSLFFQRGKQSGGLTTLLATKITDVLNLLCPGVQANSQRLANSAYILPPSRSFPSMPDGRSGCVPTARCLFSTAATSSRHMLDGGRMTVPSTRVWLSTT